MKVLQVDKITNEKWLNLYAATYENQEGRPSASRQALTQGLRPKFPGLPGAKAVKVSARMTPQLPAGTAIARGN